MYIEKDLSMSKAVASAAIRGAHKIVAKAEKKWKEAIDRWGANEPVGFPNTAYYLPVIYGILGHKVERLSDMEWVINKCKDLTPFVKEDALLSRLEPALDAGIATFFAEEIIEAIRYLENPNCYTKQENPFDDNLWLGAADDVILRKRGVEFVDGTAPGLAVILGAAPTREIAVKIAKELQLKNLYVFMTAENEGKRFSEQLKEAGVQIGWPTRLVSFGPEITSAVLAVGFAIRVALSFGRVEPGDFKKLFVYSKDRISAFVLTLGEVTEEWCANGLGCVNFGFPIIADTPIPKLLSTEVCADEHIVSNVAHSEIVRKAIEVSGLKIVVTEVPVPVAYGPAFEGERVRGDDIHLECGGGKTDMVEWLTKREMDEVKDGLAEVIGPDIKDVKAGDRLPMAIYLEVAGRKFEKDFEPILERQIHHLINYAQGIMHIGQRDIAWLRVSKEAVAKGFTLEHIGRLLHAKIHQDFGNIFDKIQIKIYTEEAKVAEILKKAREVYRKRDDRVEGMTDELVDIFYSCTLCQSFAPSHVCIISPERTGLCGAYNWMDCKAAYEINPTGPNQPVEKGECLDARLGMWKGCNEFLARASGGRIDHYYFYSIMHDPMTACGCFECVSAILPMCNGIMTVNREYTGETPCGMRFTTLAGTIGGGVSTPGFVGHSKYNICQRKFISGDGGIKRLVWMPKMLKEEILERLKSRSEEIGIPDFPDMIADETIGVTEDEILPFLQENGHPALSLDPLM